MTSGFQPSSLPFGIVGRAGLRVRSGGRHVPGCVDDPTVRKRFKIIVDPLAAG